MNARDGSDSIMMTPMETSNHHDAAVPPIQEMAVPNAAIRLTPQVEPTTLHTGIREPGRTPRYERVAQG